MQDPAQNSQQCTGKLPVGEDGLKSPVYGFLQRIQGIQGSCVVTGLHTLLQNQLRMIPHFTCHIIFFVGQMIMNRIICRHIRSPFVVTLWCVQ